MTEPDGSTKYMDVKDYIFTKYEYDEMGESVAKEYVRMPARDYNGNIRFDENGLMVKQEEREYEPYYPNQSADMEGMQTGMTTGGFPPYGIQQPTMTNPPGFNAGPPGYNPNPPQFDNTMPQYGNPQPAYGVNQPQYAQPQYGQQYNQYNGAQQQQYVGNNTQPAQPLIQNNAQTIDNPYNSEE